jgi:hypothetical protein
MTFRDENSNAFIFDVFGVVTGTFGSNQFPDVPCSMARFKARSGNPGSFFIGHLSGTVPLPFELDAGNDTDWFVTTNLNRYFHNGSSGTTDILAYWIQK